jgi:ATP adenylyltransferase
MEQLWAPWRMEYIVGPKTGECIFCLPPETSSDRNRLILHATNSTLIMLNRYPYSNGHLMVAPRQHTCRLEALSEKTSLELFSSLVLCQQVLENRFKPQGFNVGMNLGKAAGAGVEDHLHIHIVPRWEGDTNFMSVLQDIRVMPEHLLDTYDKLVPFFRG